MRKRLPTYLAGLDTEDDSKGNVTYLALVHEHGTYTARDPGAMLDHLVGLALKYPKKQVQVWTTNLEYDAVNLWGDRIGECDLRFGRHALYGIRWKRIEFRDTLRHIPASVKELGELVGLKKIETGKREKFGVDRCLRDAAITYRAARLLKRFFATWRTYPRSTLPSTAFAIWRESFWKRSVEAPWPEVRDSARKAYYGGRVEPFAVGEFKNVRVADVASMFPWSMTVAPLPLPWGPFERTRELEPNGIYYADVGSEVTPGVLPVRTDRGTIFPTGKFSGWWVGCELILAKELGARVRIRSGIRFVLQTRPFVSYVRTMFRRKQKARGALRTMYKLMLNSLYGKFGQTGQKVRVMSVREFLALDRAPLDFRFWNGLVFWNIEHAPPPWGNFVWPAIITARARVRLMSELIRLKDKGCRPLYCDTDAVIFQGSASYPLKARRIGDFELRGEFPNSLILGKKEYGLQDTDGSWLLHVKGVPSAVRDPYLRTGEAEYMLPFKMRGAARSGERANVWRSVRKKRRTDLRKRSRTSDGSLRTARL